ncbi:sulfite exporter TauE/SafE family protein [Oceanobacter mangrovi]|uniref:sulfite exporter TauE/SafE family protein n=1 Tax=Oceanobacter mangrovi TaxID=2862510 RepID=UPI001C8E38C4|nr:sulfite exporter TauE/SafE family protein [Oceanobacter mangrovi]
MTEPLSLLTALLLGLFGSSHCLVMCGGIAAAIGQSSTSRSLPVSALAFNSGRILTYILLGALVASLGLWLQQLNDLMLLVLRSIAGLLLILMGLYVARWTSWLTWLEKSGQLLWKKVQPQTGKLMAKQDLGSRFLLGMLWGLLPCGLIYSTLSWVAANADVAGGALAMACFGAGTLPALFAGSLASRSLSQLLGHRWTRTIAGIFLIGYGLITLWSIWFNH